MGSHRDKSESAWRAQLSAEQYRVTRLKGTEPPFTGAYVHEKRQGTYACVCCGEPLFASDAKYDSGSGWPSFTAPLDAEAVATDEDRSHFMVRTEILCASCDAHLGHVFPDGPEPTGQRFCVNSASLRFDPED